MLNVLRRIPLPLHVRREAVTLAVLSGMAGLLLLGVSALSGVFQMQQESLATRWATRGEAELKAENYTAAVTDFRTALRYSHDDYSQELGLAEALVGLNRVDEAHAYLVSLWDREPENGVVNRELARIAAGKHEVRDALRYYHNAVYAIWRVDGETERRNTRWELIKYLLSLNLKAQAQSELISLSAEVGADPAQQMLLGTYFLKVDDPQHAYAAFRENLVADPRNSAALAGAGEAAFDMDEYGVARNYLRRAVTEAPGNRSSAALLETTEQVIRLDPFRRQLPGLERANAVMAAFEIAGDRLKSCPAAASASGAGAAPAPPPGANTSSGKVASPAPPPTLMDAWNQLKPSITQRKLRGNPDLINQAMDLVFNIERQANGKCGTGSPSDTALLLISKMHEGS